ncbi:MAG: type I glutamate--ammonia ligase [Deltaproteobacteria bacterium]|nr:type I glutamate--ammonia ligase [Deltaproteobacteria bacterium]
MRSVAEGAVASNAAEREKKREIIKTVEEKGIRFIKLNFTDIFGFGKNLEITPDELEKALDGEMMFDGSSVDGFGRVEESDMYLIPDLDTFQPVPLRPNEMGVGQIFCDVYDRERKPFEGCPRNILKRVLGEAASLGYRLNVGPEGEFFLFNLDDKGNPLFDFHDQGGYFDNTPFDKGVDAKRDMIMKMKELGFFIEASHHEVAPGQHEIDFKYDEALKTADRWMLFKQIVKNIAHEHGLYASFLPKPFTTESGNAMHCNQSLSRRGVNAFSDPESATGLSKTAEYYVGGLMKHAKEIAAVSNPTINSYKRLVANYEAPTSITWSFCNRSSFIRIPNARGQGTRVELRTPDPTANPYLVFAVMLRAGLEGIRGRIEPPKRVDKNNYELSPQEKGEFEIEQYPSNLYEALKYMSRSTLLRKTLGSHAFNVFLKTKVMEWREYDKKVHRWEIDYYLKKY